MEIWNLLPMRVGVTHYREYMYRHPSLCAISLYAFSL